MLTTLAEVPSIKFNSGSNYTYSGAMELEHASFFFGSAMVLTSSQDVVSCYCCWCRWKNENHNNTDCCCYSNAVWYIISYSRRTNETINNKENLHWHHERVQTRLWAHIIRSERNQNEKIKNERSTAATTTTTTKWGKCQLLLADKTCLANTLFAPYSGSLCCRE